ncbi:N-acyl-phosphatidylethanolamine-hydrolyzing phospholipase D [Pelomonas saccharophila]|uniref:N-acyl-phosphatidylethanolamine-hydrolyzing phospholipase D n=1 Tax=Roseateles saccharophilus TaxID=304 RepID=A0ABU1YMD3_ROSSA|nr:MBL fold metallo-hydrolase [Roseateles saccharophilus]MDR7270019.1 N-acyl-phosphatidylethanolamine-hydrolyzing phospholipase D [Roseateles saccharophilus]
MTRPAHHRDGHFQNNHGDFEPRSLAEVIRWKWNAARQGLPKRPTAPIPTQPADLAFIRANVGAGQRPAVTWIGHATVLAQLGGLSLLTDPIFSERASPLSFAGPKREQPPGVALAELPHIDAVLVSHNHYDHLDLASCRALARQPAGSPLFVVPLGLQAWFRARGIERVVELDWWQAEQLDGLDIVLVPAQHWSARGLNDRMKTLWGGFAAFAPDCQLFFAGDTGYSRDFTDIRERFAERQHSSQGGGFDIALIPIGAYEPRWFMQNQHVNVEEALKIHADLGAKRSLGVHWGTFELTDEALDEPPRQLERQRAALGLAEGDFFTLAIGATRRIPPRGV